MKLLRNPVVVILLAVAALALVLNSFWPMIQRSGMFQRAHTAAVKTTVESLAKMVEGKKIEPPPPPAPTNAAPTNAVIEISQVEQNATRWAESPRRDPFQSRIRPRNPVGSYPAAMELLTLNAVWYQAEAKVVVINQHVLGEGDKILEFKIDAIDADRVWVNGPNGREQVEFKPPGAPTNAPAPAVEK